MDRSLESLAVCVAGGLLVLLLAGVLVPHAPPVSVPVSVPVTLPAPPPVPGPAPDDRRRPRLPLLPRKED
jgi:hypothetical protein